jgi:hypothetical protein
MRAALILACAPLAACVGPAPAEPPASVAKSPIRVMRADGRAFGFDEGAAARVQADEVCGGKVRTSIYDRYEAGAWVFVEGCA